MALDKILNRSSVRAFKKHDLTTQEIKLIKDIINSSPTSTNAHQFSAILIINQSLKDAIMKVNYNQKHISDGSGVIVFLGDRSRINMIMEQKKTQTNLNPEYNLNELSRMIMDASLAASITQVGLNEMGFGTAYIGGLQTQGKYVEKILNLPENSFVVVGLSFGVPTNKQKTSPRLNKVFLNQYDIAKSQNEVARYNQATKEYFKSFAKKDYVNLIAEQFSSDHYYYKHFVKAGAYLKTFLEKFK